MKTKLKKKVSKSKAKSRVKAKKRNPERFQVGDFAYYSIFGSNGKNPKLFEKVKIVDVYNNTVELEHVNPRFWGISQYDPKNETLLTVEEFKKL